jgi:head-tail adaptor
MNLPNIGELRQRIYIEKVLSESRDSHNQVQQNWGLVGMRWAKIQDKSGETISIQQAGTRANVGHTTIVIRYFAGLTVKHRLRYGALADDLLDLTADELAALTAEDLLSMTGAPAEKPTHYRISAIIELDAQKRFQMVEGTSVPG